MAARTALSCAWRDLEPVCNVENRIVFDYNVTDKVSLGTLATREFAGQYICQLLPANPTEAPPQPCTLMILPDQEGKTGMPINYLDVGNVFCGLPTEQQGIFMPKRKKDTKFIRATLDLCESNVVTSMKCH
jgi:hypothetical protein